MLGLVYRRRKPCRRPIKAGEVGNNDARKHHGLEVPVIAYVSQFPQCVRPWRASGSASSSTARPGVLSSRRRTASRQPRDRQVEPVTQVDGRLIHRQLGGGAPQVQRIAVGAAAKALPAVAFQMRGERAAARRACAVQRTRTTHLGTGTVGGHEAQQVQDLAQTQHAAQGTVIDASHHDLPVAEQRRGARTRAVTVPETSGDRRLGRDAACGRRHDPGARPGCPASSSCRASSRGVAASP